MATIEATDKCLFCGDGLGHDAAVKTINGVEWKLHRCLLKGCANEFNKLSAYEQQVLVEKAVEKAQQLSSLANRLIEPFMQQKEVIQPSAA